MRPSPDDPPRFAARPLLAPPISPAAIHLPAAAARTRRDGAGRALHHPPCGGPVAERLGAAALLLLLALATPALEGQKLPFLNLTTEDGLAAPQVWDVLRDRRGYLWIATSEGLNRFDGVELQSFTAADGLRNQVVRRLLEDREGRLWLATNDGLARYDGKALTFFSKPEGIPGGIVWDMALDGAGNVWFGTAGGLGVLAGERLGWFGRADGLADDDVYSLHASSRGELWVGTRRSGVARCTLGRGPRLAGCQVLTTADGLGHNSVRAIVEDAAGRIYLGTRGGGVSRFAGGRLTSFGTEVGLPDSDVYALLVDRRGELVVGTARSGVAICSLPELASCRLLRRANGLLVDGVLGLDQDAEGNLWFGLGQGLSRLVTEKLQSFDDSFGIPGPGAYAVLPEPGGEVWIGSFDGLVRLRPRPGYAPPELGVWGERHGLPSGETWDVLRDRRGRLWVGTSRGLCRFDEATQRCAEVYDESRGLAGSYVLDLLESRQGDLWVGMLTGASRLRFGDQGAPEVLSFTERDGLAGDQVQSLAEDRYGNIWLACNGGGLTAFRDGALRSWTRTEGLPSQNLYGVFAAADGDVWLGTGGAGVIRFRPGPSLGTPLRFQVYGPASGLPATTVPAIRQGPNGRLWLGTTSGLYLFAPRGRDGRGAVERHLDRSSGLVSKDLTSSNSLAFDQRGRLWMALNGGLTLYDPALEEPPPPPPAAAFERVSLGPARVLRAPFTAPAGLRPGEAWLDPDAVLSLPPGSKNLRFDFRGLSARGRLLYRHQLAGFDPGWSAPSADPFKEYTNLDPGNYRFRVQAAGADGRWGPAAQVAVLLRPSWWQTPAFLALLLLLVSLLLAFGHRARTRRIKSRSRDLEALVGERTDDLRRYARALEEHSHALDRANARIRQTNRFKTQFLANMSHELRTPLNAIIGFSQVLVRRLEGRVDARELGFLKNVLDSGRHLLHVINNLLDLSKIEAGKMEVHVEQAELAAVVEGVCAVMEGYCREREVTVRQQLPAHLTPIEVDVPKLKQILFNLLSNAIKFSERGGTVEVEARPIAAGESPLEVDSYEIVVTDHGVGIRIEDQETIFEEFRQIHHGGDRPAGTGLGLAIVYRFVNLLGGEIDLDSEAGRGASFRVLLPQQASERVPRSRDTSELEPAVRPRVLVVEDDRASFNVLAEVLERGGYLPVRARDGEEALRVAREVRPAVLVLDLALPWGEGWGVLATLAAAPDTGRLPVVLVALREQRQLAVAVAFDECLLEPLEPRALAEALRRHTPPAAREQGVPVLLVADDAGSREQLEIALAGAGLASLAASEWRRAIELARAHRPRAVVISLAMPPLEAFALGRSLQRDARTARIPLLALAPRHLSSAERQQIARQLVDQLEGRPDELVAAIAALLARGEEEAADAPRSAAEPRQAAAGS